MATRKRHDKRCCEVSDCVAITFLYSFPTEDKLRNSWRRFVRTNQRPEFEPDGRSAICKDHFTSDQFVNIGAFTSGFANRLILKSDAIPNVTKTSNLDNACTSAISSRAARAFTRDVTKPPLIPKQKLVTLPSHPDRESRPTIAPMPKIPGRSVNVQTRKYLFRPKRKSVATSCNILGAPKLIRTAPTDLPSDPETDSDDSVHEIDDDKDWSLSEDSEAADTPDLEHNNVHDNHVSPITKGEFFDSPKVIVEVDRLEMLLYTCRLCAGRNSLKKYTVGGYMKFTTHCKQCGHDYSFETTTKIKRLPTINAVLSGSILFNGLLPSDSIRFLKSINVAMPSRQTFFSYQRDYLHSIIREQYNLQQRLLLETIENAVHVAGDGRCDSPGHSALFGTYSLMDTNTKKILCMHVLKSTESSSSNAMEVDGLVRCLNELSEKSINIESLTTDRHPMVEGYMKREQPAIAHYFDTWHVVKGLKKRLCEVAKYSAFRKVAKWIRSITNHLYWTVQSSEPHSELRREQWLSIRNHLQDVHVHPNNAHFKQCLHGPAPRQFIVDGKKYVRDYFTRDGLVAEKVGPMLEDARLVSSIAQCSPYPTGDLESYHSMLNRNCPKSLGFSHHGMISSNVSRAQLTVMHHNENCNRQHKKNKDGRDRVAIVRHKTNKQTPTAYYIKEDASFDYRDKLFMELEAKISNRRKCRLQPTGAATLASTGEQLSREEVISRQRTRGLQKPHHIPAEDVELEGSRRKRRKDLSSLS